MKKNIAILLLITLVISGCAKGSSNSSSVSSSSQAATVPPGRYIDWNKVNLKQLTPPASGTEIAVMKTSMGNIKIMFFPVEAPKAVENFITLAKKGYYNGQKFHRVIKDFMLQSGDPTGTGTGGESIWGAPFNDEFSLNLYNFRGALCMANSGENTNQSQFFIVQAPTAAQSYIDQMTANEYGKKVIDAYTKLGGAPWLDGVHTVFGQVVEGMDVVDAIAAVPTENDAPKTDVTIISITFEKV